MIDRAGRDGLPVFFAEPVNPAAGCYLVSPGSRPINLSAKGMPTEIYNVFFSDSGSLIIYAHSTTSEMFPDQWVVEFPDRVAIPSVYNYRGEFSLNSNALGSIRTNTRLLGSHSFQIFNCVTGVAGYEYFDPPPPFNTGRYYAPIINDYIAVNFINIIAAELIPSGSYLVPNVSRMFWRYDALAGEWSSLLEIPNSTDFTVGEDASVFCVQYEDDFPFHTVFYDGFSGEALASIDGERSLTIGRRWVLRNDSTYFSPVNIRLLDINNGFKEFNFTCPGPSFSKITMFEPPPGGMAELLETRNSRD